MLAVLAQSTGSGFSDNETGMIIGALAVGGSMLIAIVGIIAGTVRKMTQTKAREESRREIAAYVAEGTISPDDAAKLLNAGSLAGHIDQIKQKLKT
jgi:hypothetical protein